MKEFFLYKELKLLLMRFPWIVFLISHLHCIFLSYLYPKISSRKCGRPLRFRF